VDQAPVAGARAFAQNGLGQKPEVGEAQADRRLPQKLELGVDRNVADQIVRCLKKKFIKIS
jgi:hypothetical protein